MNNVRIFFGPLFIVLPCCEVSYRMGGPVKDLRRLLFLSEVDPAVSDKLPRTVNVAHIQLESACLAGSRLHLFIPACFDRRRFRP